MKLVGLLLVVDVRCCSLLKINKEKKKKKQSATTKNGILKKHLHHLLKSKVKTNREREKKASTQMEIQKERI